MANSMTLLGVGGGAFSPPQISGLQLWLKADAGLSQDAAGTTPASSDGDPVGRWADQSGNANHATQSNGTFKPTLRLNIQNGLPVVRCDGVDDRLSIADVAGLNFGQGSFAAFAVLIQRNASSYRVIWGKGTGPSADNIRLFFTDTALPEVFWGSDAQAYAAGANAIAQNVASAVMWQVDAPASKARYLMDGTQTERSITLSGTGSNALAAFIGGDNFGPYYAQNDIGELIIYKATLTTAQNSLVTTYLKNKWGTP